MPIVLHSTTFKVFGIGFLALLMLIPLSEVRGLINERSALREQAVSIIAQRWGAQQQLGGPVLAVPKLKRVQSGNEWVTQESTEILLPDKLDFHATLIPEIRRYGIYDTPVYTSEIKLTGSFLARDLQTLGESQVTYVWERAQLRIPISDVRGIRRISPLHFGDAEFTLGPGDGEVGAIATVAAAWVPTKPSSDSIPFAVDMTLAGTQFLHFLPLARHTEASLAAPWPDPSFDAAFLPAERRVDANGFNARWQVLDLNRSFGQHWEQDAQRSMNLAGAGFGVSLYQPVGVYQQNERAGKYGLLFIGLTFVAFFLFEVLRRLRVHPVQYLLIGFALTTFYVVLLALSEQLGFSWSYVIAAAAVIAMIGRYAAAVLKQRRAGFILSALMALVYALLYGLIVSEQYSLMMGAVALLAVVAAVMYLTRRVDWYGAIAAPVAVAR